MTHGSNVSSVDVSAAVGTRFALPPNKRRTGPVPNLDFDPEMKERLRIRAARHGRSMEEEVRVILRSTLAEGTSNPMKLGTAIHRRFAALNGVDLALPTREPMREPPLPR